MGYKARVCGWPQRHRNTENEPLAGSTSARLQIDLAAFLFLNVTVVMTLADRALVVEDDRLATLWPALSFKRHSAGRA